MYSKPREIAKRTAIFTASGQAGSMFAGVMMTAIYKGMNGYVRDIFPCASNVLLMIDYRQVWPVGDGKC